MPSAARPKAARLVSSWRTTAGALIVGHTLSIALLALRSLRRSSASCSRVASTSGRTRSSPSRRRPRIDDRNASRSSCHERPSARAASSAAHIASGARRTGPQRVERAISSVGRRSRSAQRARSRSPCERRPSARRRLPARPPRTGNEAPLRPGTVVCTTEVSPREGRTCEM